MVRNLPSFGRSPFSSEEEEEEEEKEEEEWTPKEKNLSSSHAISAYRARQQRAQLRHRSAPASRRAVVFVVVVETRETLARPLSPSSARWPVEKKKTETKA